MCLKTKGENTVENKSPRAWFPRAQNRCNEKKKKKSDKSVTAFKLWMKSIKKKKKTAVLHFLER